MGLDLKKMREQQKNISSAAGGGDDKSWLHCKKLKPEEFVKPMPDPTDALNGSYYIEQIGWWINGKFYMSNQTFNEDCVIQQEYDKAKKLGESDKQMKAVIEAKNPKNNAPLLQREVSYLASVLHLALEFNPDNEEEVDKVTIIDDKVKIFAMKPTLMDDFHRVVTSKAANKKGGWGAMDQESGMVIQVGKEGAGTDTKYYAQAFERIDDDDVYEVLSEDKYYTADAIPNLYKIVTDQRKSDDYLRAIIRNYLYGEDMPKDEKSSDKEAADTANTADTRSEKSSGRSGRSSKNTAKVTKHSDPDPEDEDEEEMDQPVQETPKRRRAAQQQAAASSPKGRSLIDDVEEELSNLD